MLAAAVAVLALTAGCTDGANGAKPSPSSPLATPVSCGAASSELVSAVQQYVDAYGVPLVSSSAADTAPAPDGSRLQAGVQAAQRSVAAGKCTLAAFRSKLDTGLSGVTADGPIAGAVLLKLTASLDGTAQSDAQTVDVAPGADLRRRVAELASGSTVHLAAGTYTLSDPLVLMDGITLTGAGRSSTVIETSASDAGILVLTDGRVELNSLSVVHSGAAASDLIVGGPSSSVVLNDIRISGAKSASGSGGNGVLMSSSSTAKPRGTTLEATDSMFDHNAAAGVVLTEGHAASLHGLTFTSNGSCGVCFSGTSGGAVRDSAFTGNTVGVAVLDSAEPAIVDDTFTGGKFAVQASDSSTPVVTGAKVSGTTSGAMIFTDKAAGRVDGSSCTGTPYGIVVGPNALPYLGTNGCAVAKGP